METMKRWLVQLQGSADDLDEFTACFPSGDIYVTVEADVTFLIGGRLDLELEAARVVEIAEQAVEEFFAVISLLNNSAKRPSVGAIFIEDVEGNRKEYFLLSANVSIKLSGKCRVQGGIGQTRTQAQLLLLGSQKSISLRNGLLVWAEPHRTWPHLYRILEEVENYLGEHVSSAGMCTEQQRSRFTCSANTAEVAGKDSRHAAKKFRIPASPMSLREATVFISDLLKASLRKPESLNKS